jgi:DNA-binding NarL/FixJ family response regulator
VFCRYGMDGIETTRQAIVVKPTLKVLGIYIRYDVEKIRSLGHVGARGFLLKGGDKKEIKKAIVRVLKNKMYFDHVV